ncbi:flagellar hook-associated protein FlgL [Niveibacterium sp. SC-1]|uniref:flagellar hook-associated protein FlgL n=1 Tax=Niveibacterium sp. SC-1 TaxID=3135646 RepID=UPI00311FB913
MRISTNMIYANGTQQFQNRASELLKIQQQLATGKRIVSPSDDPIASATSLLVSQAKGVNSQYGVNRGNASTSLAAEDNVLGGVGDLVTYVKERVVQAGNGALSRADLEAISTDLKASFDSLVGLSNSRDASGGYMFAGFQSDTQPFVGDATSGVAYRGDQGSRSMQISESRVIPVSDPGDKIFMKIPNSNGAFNTAAASTNTGRAIIDDGTVTGSFTGHSYALRFTTATDYEVYDTTNPGPAISTGTYTSGQPIAFDGIQVTVAGSPAGGDEFDVTPGGYTDAFTSMKKVIDALDIASSSELPTFIAQGLDRLDKTLDNVLQVRASVGSRMNEIDAVENVGSQADVQYAATLSRLGDLDYAEAVSSLAQRTVALQAAQQAFVKTTGLSLFNYLS